MGLSIEFIKERATATFAAQKAIAAKWVWQEMSLADFEGEIKGVTDQEEVTATAERVMLGARSAWDGKLEGLHGSTMQGVSMLKNRFRNDRVKLALVQNLSARGDSRSATLDEALDWEKAWAQAAPNWVPMPANTLAAFGQLRLECLDTLQNAYKGTLSAWREEAGKLAERGRILEDKNEAWYSDATDVFAAGTPEGDMIRGTIPTTYTPSATGTTTTTPTATTATPAPAAPAPAAAASPSPAPATPPPASPAPAASPAP